MHNNNFNKEMEKGTSSVEASLPVGYKLSSKTKENINNILLNTIGMSYDEYDKLDCDEQQEIIKQYHKKNHKSKDKSNFVMIGNDESVMIGSGEHSCFVETGLTPEEESIRLNDELDGKPKALVKK